MSSTSRSPWITCLDGAVTHATLPARSGQPPRPPVLRLACWQWFFGAELVAAPMHQDGQHGIGVTWPSPDLGRVDQNELIFDKKTLQNIGEKQFNAKTGRVDFEVAIQQRLRR